MSAPRESLAADEALSDLGLSLQKRDKQFKRSGAVEGTVLVGKHGSLFGRKRIALRRRVVFDISTRSLVDQPLSNVPFISRSFYREFVRSNRSAGRQSLEEIQPIADIRAGDAG